MPPFFTALPEPIWAEVNRRLQLEPLLRELTANQDIATAFVSLGDDLDLWRPGQLGLTALSVIQPKAAADPVQWLKSAGREHLAKAYHALTAPETQALDGAQSAGGLPPFVRATLAAVALHQRHNATHDLDSIVADAAAAPQRWALPLVCLYGLLEDPRGLIVALLREASRHPEAVTNLCELAARILVDNEKPDDLVESIRDYVRDLPTTVRLALARFFAGNGLDHLARCAAASDTASPSVSGAGPAGGEAGGGGPDLPTLFRNLADSLDHIFLSEYSGEESARPWLGRAVEAAQCLTAELALHLGQFSLSEGDPISAIAAFQEAQALRPYDRQTHALIAQASALRGDERTALIALSHASLCQNAPGAKLAAARAHQNLGNMDQAREIARELMTRDAQKGIHELDTAQLVEAAELLSSLKDHEFAMEAWQEVLTRRPADARAYLVYAGHALASDQTELAVDSAWQAVGLSPSDGPARQVLAEALGRQEHWPEAVEQWQRAVDVDPQPKTQLKFAEAALAAQNYELAFKSATAILKTHDADPVASTGLPHIIAGRALTAMGDAEQAFEYFNKAVALAPASVESWRAVAAYHKSQGDVQRALAALDAGRHLIDHTSPQAADFYADLGALRAELHHLTEASAALEKAAQLQPTRVDFLKRLGELYWLQNKLPAAVEVIQRAASVAMRDPVLWHLLGRLLEAAGRQPDALAAYRHAQSVGGRLPQLFRDLGRLAYQLHDVAVARAALEEILIGRERYDRDDLDALTLLGAIYEQVREFESALTAYKHAIAIEPTRSDLCVRLGVCCLELGQPEAAIAALKDTAERDIENLALQKVIGDAYAAAHLWLEAILAYEQASSLAPDDHQLLQTFARVAKQAGEPDRAIAALQKAISLAPDRAEYRRDLGDLFISVAKPIEAKEAFIEACHLMPGACDLWIGLGQAHLMLSEIPEAAEAFERACSVDPTRTDVLLALGSALALLGKFEKAHAAFARAAELEPANPIALRRAADCMWELGREAMAIALWQKLLVTHPHDAATHARLGSAFMKQERFSEALAAFEQAAEDAPADSQLAIHTAQAAMSAGEVERAMAHLERAAQTKPDEAEVWLLLAQASRAKGLVDNALSAVRRALRLAPTNGCAHAALAQLLIESGNVAEAITSAEAALKASPDDIVVLGILAQVFLSAGRLADAVAAATKVARAKPSDPSAHLALARALVLDAESSLLTQPAVLDSITRSLEKAAALGGDAAEVREWTGRARALSGQLVEAVSLLESVVTERPSADLLRILASCYRRLGRLPLARQAILSALDHAPNAVANVIELGLICLVQDDRGAARAAFQRAISIDMHCAHAYQLLADTILTAGERGEAIVLYNQAISLDPSHAAWHHRLAELYEAGRETESALAHYQRAAALAAEQGLPARETANYLAALARAYARDRDLDAARKEFEAALTLRDDNPTWWSQCGHINFELALYQRAFECFSRACELQPNDTASYMGAARAALALGREQEAEEKATSVLRYNPDNYDALIVMAEICERRGDSQNALLAYAHAAEHACQPLTALLARARLLRRLDRAGDAIAVLQRVIELGPEDDEALALLGETYVEAGQPAEALPYFQRAIQIAPRKVAHHLRLARAYRQIGQLDAALGHLQHARELAPDATEALLEMAQVFEGRRQFNRAYEIYQQLMTLEPNNAENFFRAGLVLKEMRDYVDALALFQQAVRLDPTNAEAQHQRATVAAIGILRGRN